MSLAVDKKPLSLEEANLFNDQILPILKTRLLPDFVPRAAATLMDAVAQAKARFGVSFGGLIPGPGQIGIAPLSGKDFNLTNTFTGFRSNYTTANAITNVVSAATTSKFAFLVILAIADLEPVVRTRAVQFVVGGVTHPIVFLPELRASERQFQEMEPFIVSPAAVVTFGSFVGADVGFDEVFPWGFVVATQNYLISTTFVA